MITSKQYVVTAQIPAIIQDLGISLPRTGAVVFITPEQHDASASLRALVQSRAVVVREIESHRFRHVPSPSNSVARRPGPADLHPVAPTNLRGPVEPAPPPTPQPAPAVVNPPAAANPPDGAWTHVLEGVQREIKTLTKEIAQLGDLRELLRRQLETAVVIRPMDPVASAPVPLPVAPEPPPSLTNSLGIDMAMPVFIPSNLVDANAPSVKVSEDSHEMADIESSVAAIRRSKRGSPK